jgi:hypothetical protein
VFFGGEVAVFEDWGGVARSTTGHGLTIHAGYPSVAAAQAALDYARSKGWTSDTYADIAANPNPVPTTSHDENPLNSGAAGTWYAVAHGAIPGVYGSYLECALNTSGIKGNLAASFPTRALAEKAYAQASAAGFVRTIPRS